MHKCGEGGRKIMFSKKLLSLVMATVLLCSGLSQNTVYAEQEVTDQECEHNYEEIIKKATEKQNGSITKQCTKCQAIEGEPTIIYAVEKIELSETSFVRDGSVKMPSITIEDSQGNALQKMIDYTINYPYAIEPGTYTIDITFSENYTGTVERTFTIMPDLTGDPQEDYTYRELEDGSLEITKYAGKETELVIPEKIDDKIVSKIAAHAFSDCKNLVSVIIPESVTSIEQRAFASCSLKSVTLPQGIKSLEKELFNYSGLTSITIPEGVTIIGEGAFGGCTNLTSVTIPEGVTTIGEAAFGGCINLTNVEIPKGVKNIEDGAFSNCNLTSVTIPEGVTSIGIMAFIWNSMLKEVVIPKSVTSIGRYVFQGCNNIVLCVYHDSCAERYAQENNINYRYIEECEHNYKTIVKKATEKENGSITKQCTECQAIEGEPTIIYAVEKIELSETSYIYDGSIKKPSVMIKDSQGNALQEQRDYTVSYPEDAKEEGTYTITITLSGIYTGTVERSFAILADHTGSSQGNYTYRELEDGSLEITKYAGNDAELVIPEKLNDKIVTKIGEHAFLNCTKLTSIILPEGVVSIGAGAFSGCSNLVSVVIPESVVSIGTDTFSGCSQELTLQVTPGSYGESYAKENDMKYRDPAACEHNYITQTVEPTCTTAGEKVSICTKCGDVEKRETIPALGHSEVKDIGKEATCTEEGKTEGSHCEVCQEVLKQQEVIPVIGHREITDPAKEATCIEEGKTEGSHCEVCQTVLKEQEIIPALGHKEVKDTGKEATCTEEGKTEGSHCEVCQEVLKKQETIPAFGHTYQKEIIKASKKKNGSITEKCSKCGSEKDKTTIYAVKTVKLSKTSYVYNGKNQKPSVIINDNKGKTLSKQKDYTISYPKTVKNVGIYTVKIKFKGNYMGAVTRIYTITPKETSIFTITPKKKSFIVTWKKQAKQTTGYEVAYAPNAKFAKKNTTILNVAKSKTTAKPKKALKAKKKYYLRIRTYKTIKQGGKTRKIYSGWSKTKSVTTKK